MAVLGAGFQGVCVALELARRGVDVDLFEVENRPITKAGLWNEGKIHLGFVYANEDRPRTAARLIPGAIFFGRWLEELLGPDVLTSAMSEPYWYLVHRDSMLSVDAIAAHFRRVEALLAQESDDPSYLGLAATPAFEPIGTSELHDRFNPRLVAAAFRTVERAVDPRLVAEALRERVAQHPRIRFVGKTRVVDTVDRRGGPAVVDEYGEASDSYDHVINCLWGGLRALDVRRGLASPRPWLIRHKVGVINHRVTPASRPPSTTVVLGPFGDTVSYATGDVYASWYPACRVGLSNRPDPGDPVAALTATERDAIATTTAAAMTELIPEFAAVTSEGPVTVDGGAIAAWGSHDIDHPDSELHHRHDIGVRSYGRYHSVDTGKYSMAPYLATVVADTVMEPAPWHLRLG